jgi:Tol biopolymer transport system component
MMNSSEFQSRETNPLKVAIREEQIYVAPEGRVTVHVGILNEAPIEDDVDLAVRGIPPEWVTIHVPGVHLAAGEAKLVTLTVQPPALPDSRVGQYTLEVRALSRIDPKRSASARSPLTVAAYQSPGRIGVLLGTLHFAVTPGSSVTVPILLQNRGEDEDSFRLNVTGLPPTWVTTNSTITALEPGTSAEIQLTLQVPRSPQAVAGRRPFTIQLVSQLFPTQTSEVECILTISAFSEFSASLEPAQLESGQFGQLIIENEGNTTDTYDLRFQSRDDELIFEKAVQVTRPGPQTGTQQVKLTYVEIPQEDRFQVPAGQRGAYSFRSRLRSRPLLGSEQTYPFTAGVRSTANQSTELSGQVSERPYLPFWFLPAGAVAALLVCLLVLIPLRGLPTSARATQTAAYNQTQAALSGTGDSDGDGLTNEREAQLGTDPLLPDTDGDRLLDREEVETHQTNPLDVDTDDDRLQDGDEFQTHQTDPRNPDTDGDGRADGDEVAGGSDPRNPDTDGDGLRDGDEIRLNTDPENPDSDNDGLQDGQENETCPRPSDPDSDDDGITDGRDLEPCSATNPALTATAAVGATASAPTATQIPTTAPSQTPPPTNTSPPAATLTQAPPSLQGLLLFESNRTGNSEIYSLNLASQTLTRLTNSAAQDIQPALSPNSDRVAYVTNQDGNNEIYIGSLAGGTPSNLTRNAADDQDPAWSPDGTWIVFTSNRDGNQEIYIMRSDGSEVRNLTNNPGSDFAPTWFSIGGLFGAQEWIAFTTTRDGNQEIYKVRPDGSDLTNLTQNPANDHSPSGFTGGAILAFVSDRSGNSDVFVMTDTGGAQTNITNDSAQDLDPAINPGGIWVAFSSDRGGNLEVYVVRVDGGTAFNLTRDPGQDRRPDW